jgi:hypothetical protein
MRKLGRLWKEISREATKQRDPSLRSQMYQVQEADPLNHPLRLQMYLDACQKAPQASPSTKKKWRKALSLDA